MIGRKSGCPTNIRDWQVMILDRDYTGSGEWIRVRGLTALQRMAESETSDGSADSDVWQEPYVIKRQVRLTLEGRRIADMATGAVDPGQQLLDDYAGRDGCAADACLRFIDPYRHVMEAEYIVDGNTLGSGREADTVSWNLLQVGEARMLPYRPVSSIALHKDGQSVSTLTLHTGDESAVIRVVFDPQDASNRRFRVRTVGRQYAAVTDIDESGFSITGLQAGQATVTVISMNGSHTASLQVTVQE